MSTEERLASPFSHDFNQNLENARVLIEESPWKENPIKYRKVAEGILRRILSIDPENRSAKRLLAKAVAPLPVAKVVAPLPVAKVVAPPPVAKVEVPLRLVKTAVPVPEAPPSPRPVTPADLSFVVPTIGPPKVERRQKVGKRSKVEKRHKVEKRQRRERVEKGDPRPPGILVGLAAVGAIAGVLLLVMHRDTFTSQYAPKTSILSPLVVQASAAIRNIDRASSTFSPVARATPGAPQGLRPEQESQALIERPYNREAQAAGAVYDRPPQAPKAPEPTAVVKSSVPAVAPIQTGTLAVSSPTTVDIYVRNQLVGSAPTTLVLPAGNQTLEYRHQDQRKVLTHVIKANKTTTTMVSFDIPVQINARPWAQVFIDGPQRQPLGQTPLSDVRVPIGSVLIFENPNFPGKNYRVTGRETEIRVTFP
jgi:hypothetical protein